MAPDGFLFLNTTGPPGFSNTTANRIRGHVTKTNFANRRRAKEALAGAAERGNRTYKLRKGEGEVSIGLNLSGSSLALALSTAMSRADKQGAAELLNEFWPIMFLHDRGVVGGENDQLWLRTLASEPAFVEATLATAIRYWLPDRACKLRAEMHSHRATTMVMDCMFSNQTESDGFIGAVLTMAISERLVGNDAAWQIHMSGLMQIIKARKGQGVDGLPALFTDLMILGDTVNNAISFPRVCPPDLARALEGHADGMITATAALARRVVLLRELVRLQRENGCKPGKGDVLSKLSEEIHHSALVLERHANPFVRCAAKTNRLLSGLTWPPPTDHKAYAIVAEELKGEMQCLPGRTCLYMDLTSCQLIVGAVASAPGSESRAWFMNRLRTGVRAMHERGWDNSLGLLELTLRNDIDLLEQFMEIWKGT